VRTFGPEPPVSVLSSRRRIKPGLGINAMPQVFQYGSNCDEARLNAPGRLEGDALCLGRVQTVDEYRIAFDVWSQTNACAASNLVLVGGTGQRSWGVLYEIPADLIRGRRTDGRRTLAQIEGIRYEETLIRVRNAVGEEVTVTTFFVRPNERRPGLWTSFDYVQHIVNGLRSHEIPEEYVQRVIDIAIETNNRATETVTEQIRMIETLRELRGSTH
jgi:AIG2 family protein